MFFDSFWKNGMARAASAGDFPAFGADL